MYNTKSMNNTQIITRSALLIALSAVGAMIKIQGTIAFDSMPGFFAALFISPMAGAAVSGLGHLLTAVTSGFPMSLPMHLMLTVIMAVIGYVFGVVAKKVNAVVACIVAILLNGPVATLLAAEFSKILGSAFNGMAMFTALVVPLTVVSTVNVILAYVIYRFMKRK